MILLLVFGLLGGLVVQASSDAQTPPARIIYDDAFAVGFSYNQWNGTNNVAATSPVKVGTKSISTKPDAYAGIFIDIADGVGTSVYTSLRFWIHGGTGGSTGFQVIPKKSLNVDAGTAQIIPAVPANTWAQVTIPLSSLVGSATTFDTLTGRSLWFVSDGTSRPTIYLDQIELVPGSGPSTTTTTVAGTTTTTTTPAATTTTIAPTGSATQLFSNGTFLAGWGANGSVTPTNSGGVLVAPLAGVGSWIVVSGPTRLGTFGSLRISAQTTLANWEVQAYDANSALVSVPVTFPAPGTDGFRVATIPWAQMNPTGSGFSAIYLRPSGTAVEIRLKTVELLAAAPSATTTTATPTTVGPTTTIQPSPAGTKVVYDDAFGPGFIPNPWNGVNNVAATSPVKIGAKSISTKPDAYAGIFINVADGVRLQDYSTLRLWVHGGTAGSSGFRVSAKRNGSIDVGKAQDFPNIGANTWVQVSISMNALLGTPSAYDAMPERAFWFTSDSVSRPTIFLDQIELVGAPTPPSTTIGMATTTTSATTIPPASAVSPFSAGVLGSGWSASGSVAATVSANVLTFPLSGTGSWLVFGSSTARTATTGGLRLRIGSTLANWDVQMYNGSTALPTVPITFPAPNGSGVREVTIPWASLNPSNSPFTGIYVRPGGTATEIRFHDVSFVTGTSVTTTTIAGPTTTVPVVSGACGAKIRVMPLGDSLTYGLMGAPNASEDSYRGHLFRSLAALGYSLDFVGPNSSAMGLGGDPDHAGFGGYTIGPDIGVDYLGTPSNLYEIVSNWVPGLNPNIIVLTIGTNDLAAGDRAVTNPAQEAANPDGVRAANLAPLRLEGLVARLRVLAPNAVIVIGDVPPSGTTTSGDPSTRKADLNTKASQLGAADPNDKVIYAPTFQRMITAGFNRSTDLVDGTHMSVSGGQKFGSAMQPSVIEAINRSGCLTTGTTTTTIAATTTTVPPTTSTTTTTVPATTTTATPTTTTTSTTTTTTTIPPSIQLAVPPGLFPGEPYVVSAASVRDGDKIEFRNTSNVVVQEYVAKPQFAAMAPAPGSFTARLVRSGTVLATAPLVVPIPPVVTVSSPDDFYTGYRVLAGVDDASRLQPNDQFRLDFVGAADDCSVCATKPAAASTTFTAPAPGTYQIRLMRGSRTVSVKPLVVRPLPVPVLFMENVQYVFENCTGFDANGLPILETCQRNPRYFPVDIDNVATVDKFRIRVSGSPNRPGDYISFAGLQLQPDQEFTGPALLEAEIRNIGATYRTQLDGKPVPLGNGLDLIFRGPILTPPACVPGPEEIRAITGADPLGNALIDGRYTCAGIIVYLDPVTQGPYPGQFYADGVTPIPNNLRNKPVPVGPNAPGTPPIVTSGRSGQVFEVPFASTIDFGETGNCLSVAARNLAYNVPECDIVIPHLAAYGLLLKRLESSASPPCLGVSASDALEFQPCSGARSQAWSDINPTIDSVNYPNLKEYFPLWTEVRGTPYCLASDGNLGSGVTLRACGAAIDPEEIWTDARIGEQVFVPGTRVPLVDGGVLEKPDTRSESRRQRESVTEARKVNPIAAACIANIAAGLIGLPNSSDDCNLRFRFIVSGSDVLNHSEHIRDAMVSRVRPVITQTGAPYDPAIPSLWVGVDILRYSKPHSRAWLKTSAVAAFCATPRKPSTDCDEYPFASTVEGGQTNFNAGGDRQLTWLREIPSTQNRSFGGRLGAFYRYSKCEIDPLYSIQWPTDDDSPIETGSSTEPDAFVVVTTNIVGSFYACRK